MCSEGLLQVVAVTLLHKTETSRSPVPQHPSLAYLNPEETKPKINQFTN